MHSLLPHDAIGEPKRRQCIRVARHEVNASADGVGNIAGFVEHLMRGIRMRPQALARVCDSRALLVLQPVAEAVGKGDSAAAKAARSSSLSSFMSTTRP